MVAATETKQDLCRQLERLDGYNLVLSAHERRQLLILKLLNHDGPLSATRLAPQLGVSQPTVLKDLRAVAEWLAEYRLHCNRRPKRGCEVIGAEVDRREALLQFLFQTLDDGFLVDLCTRGKPSRQPGLATGLGLRTALAEFLDSLELDFARQQVQQLERWLDRKFTDRAVTALTPCVAILVSRVGSGFVVQASPERQAALARTAEFDAAHKVTLATAKRLGRALPEDETVNVAVQLLGAGVRKTLADLISSKPEEGLEPKVRERSISL